MSAADAFDVSAKQRDDMITAVQQLLSDHTGQLITKMEGMGDNPVVHLWLPLIRRFEEENHRQLQALKVLR